MYTTRLKALLLPCICVFLYILTNLFFLPPILPFLRYRECDLCCQDTERFAWVYREAGRRAGGAGGDALFLQCPRPPSLENQCYRSPWVGRKSLSWVKNCTSYSAFSKLSHYGFLLMLCSGETCPPVCHLLGRAAVPPGILQLGHAASSEHPEQQPQPTLSRAHQNKKSPPRKTYFRSV